MLESPLSKTHFTDEQQLLRHMAVLQWLPQASRHYSIGAIVLMYFEAQCVPSVDPSIAHAQLLLSSLSCECKSGGAVTLLKSQEPYK